MNWFKRFKTHTQSSPEWTNSILADEKSFYYRFSRDLLKAKHEVIIDSPYITIPRLRSLKSTFELLIERGVEIFIFTKPPEEQDEVMYKQSEAGIRYFETLGVQVLLCVGHHRKLAMIDRKLLWEGSLNILSQTQSREIMRRIESKTLTEEMFDFLKLGRFI